MGRRLTDEEIAAAVRIGTEAASLLQATGLPDQIDAEPYSPEDPFSRDWQRIVLELRHLGWDTCKIEALVGVDASAVRQIARGDTREPKARTGLALLWLLGQARAGLRPEHVAHRSGLGTSIRKGH